MIQLNNHAIFKLYVSDGEGLTLSNSFDLSNFQSNRITIAGSAGAILMNIILLSIVIKLELSVPLYYFFSYGIIYELRYWKNCIFNFWADSYSIVDNLYINLVFLFNLIFILLSLIIWTSIFIKKIVLMMIYNFPNMNLLDFNQIA